MNPVKTLLTDDDAITLATKDPSPQLQITILKPAKTRMAVPAASEIKSLYVSFGAISANYSGRKIIYKEGEDKINLLTTQVALVIKK
jgi:hypothetical protein